MEAQVEAELVVQLEEEVLVEQASHPLEPREALTSLAKEPARASLSMHLELASTAQPTITNMLPERRSSPSTTRQTLLSQAM